MARCVFCGGKAAFGMTINRSMFNFKACPECYERFKDADEDVVLEQVLLSGIYSNLNGVKERINEITDTYRKSLEEYQKWVGDNTFGACPKCGGAMILKKALRLITASDDFLLPTTNISTWNTNEMEVEAHICEECGYIEFYSSGSVARNKRYKQRAEYLKRQMEGSEDSDDRWT